MGSRKVSTPKVEPAAAVAAEAKEANTDMHDNLSKERRRGIANTYNRFASDDGKAKLGV